MSGSKELVQRLGLEPHPEGGYYSSTYRASLELSETILPPGFSGPRPISSAIYYLLEEGDFSAFHRIKSDECWHFYEGGTLLLHCISPEGSYNQIQLGRASSQYYQYVVPAGEWFAAEPMQGTSFTLAGCTVAPGFHFNEFELAKADQLSSLFPQHQALINRLCR